MTARPREICRIALSSLAGTTVEYYDFMLYATMTALVFDRIFFPGSDRSTAGWPALFALKTTQVGGQCVGYWLKRSNAPDDSPASPLVTVA